MQSQTQRAILIVILGAALVGAAWLFVWIFAGFLILFAGVLCGIFLNGLARRVASWLRLKYEPAFAIVVTVLLLICGGTIFLMGSQIFASIQQLVQEFQAAQDQLMTQLNRFSWWKTAVNSVQEGQQSALPMHAVTTATSAASGMLTAFGGIVLVFFLGFYFALQPQTYRSGFLALLPDNKRQRAAEVLDDINGTLWRWLLGRMIGMAVIGISSGIGLALIGIPLPVTLGVLAGLLTFVPNLGPLLSVVPPLLFSFQQGGYTAVYVLVLYGSLQFFESYFLTPMITQHQVGLPPGLTLSSQLLFGMLAGFLGLLLATPLTAVIVVLVNDLYVKDSPVAAADT